MAPAAWSLQRKRLRPRTSDDDVTVRATESRGPSGIYNQASVSPSTLSTLMWVESLNGPIQESFSSLNLEEKSSVSCVHFLTGLAPVTRVLLNSQSMCVSQRGAKGWGAF